MKKLSVGHTLIGTKQIKYKGKTRTIEIYYGNFCQPLIDDEFIVLNKEEYEKMLDDFIASDEGSEYEAPTLEEIEAASKEVKEIERKYREKDEEIPQEKNIKVNHNNSYGVIFQPIDESEMVEEERTVKIKESLRVNKEEKPVSKKSEPIPVSEKKETVTEPAVKKKAEEKSPEISEELLEKVKEASEIYKKQDEMEKENMYLRNSLDKEKRALLKEKEAHEKTKFLKNKNRDDVMDSILFRTVTIMLIIASCIIYLLFFISLYK